MRFSHTGTKFGFQQTGNSSYISSYKLYFSGRDLSAAVNLGRVFAERCLKAGIVSVFYDPNTDVHGSEKVFFFKDPYQ